MGRSVLGMGETRSVPVKKRFRTARGISTDKVRRRQGGGLRLLSSRASHLSPSRHRAPAIPPRGVASPPSPIPRPPSRLRCPPVMSCHVIVPSSPSLLALSRPPSLSFVALSPVPVPLRCHVPVALSHLPHPLSSVAPCYVLRGPDDVGEVQGGSCSSC